MNSPAGGFVLKKAPAATDREAFMKEGVACYQEYLRGLLDGVEDAHVARAAAEITVEAFLNL